jgi:hypothetical protein
LGSARGLSHTALTAEWLFQPKGFSSRRAFSAEWLFQPKGFFSRRAFSAEGLFQPNETHGFGAEVSIPQMINADPFKQIAWKIRFPCEVIYAWRRKASPTLGLRYRYFVNDNVFAGTSLDLGFVGESLFLQRPYRPSG